MTGYSNIAVYYNTLFSLVQHHKYTLTEVYDMYPYERDLFVELLNLELNNRNRMIISYCIASGFWSAIILIYFFRFI